MKKYFFMLGLLCVLLLGCASAQKAGVGDQIINDLFGELYVEHNGGFSMYVPRDWEKLDMNQKYLMVFGSVENDFAANFNFGDDAYSGPINEYLDAVIDYLSEFYMDFAVLERSEFVSDSGLKGEYVTMLGRVNDIGVRQRMYILPDAARTRIMAITASTSSYSGTKYDFLFDECVKTFNWLN